MIIVHMQAASDWLCIYPRGFRELLLFIKKQYNNPVIYITENGNTSIILYFLRYYIAYRNSNEANENVTKLIDRL